MTASIAGTEKNRDAPDGDEVCLKYEKMTLKTSDNPPPCNPENIFDLNLDSLSPWWVVRTKSRQEKALAWSLKKAGISYYLPLLSRPQKNRKRLRMSMAPLFSGYLFLRGTHMERYESLQTGRVAQVIPVEDQVSLRKELKRIYTVSAMEKRLELCDFVEKGQRARVIYGPFACVEGIVERKKNKTRLILTVEVIRQAVRVEIDIDQVQLI